MLTSAVANDLSMAITCDTALLSRDVWRFSKKVVLVINKMDLLSGDASMAQEVVTFVTSAAKTLLGSSPCVFPVSSRLALVGKMSHTSTQGQPNSGLEPLERYMKENLDSEERFSVKLDASAAVGTTIANKYIKFLHATKEVVEADARALAELNATVDRYVERVRKGFSAQYARVDNALLHMLDRADMFLDANVRISNIPSLVHKQKLMKDFEEQVVAGTANSVQRQAEAMAEWLTEKSSRSMSDTTAIFARRMGERTIDLQRICPDESQWSIARSLAVDPHSRSHKLEWSGSEDTVISGLSKAVADLSSTYATISDGKRIADKVATSVRTALTLEVGAVGLLGALLGTSSLDVTGLASTSLLASAGLVVLPRRRVTLRRELRSKVTTLRARLQEDLRSRVTEHVEAHVARIHEAIEPFAKFTTTKQQTINQNLEALHVSLESIGAAQRKLHESVQQLDRK